MNLNRVLKVLGLLIMTHTRAQQFSLTPLDWGRATASSSDAVSTVINVAETESGVDLPTSSTGLRFFRIRINR